MLRKLITVRVVSAKSIRKHIPGNEVESRPKTHHITCKTNFCCDVLKSGFKLVSLCQKKFTC